MPQNEKQPSKLSKFGKALPFICKTHTDKNGIMAENGSDFNLSPNGGCDKLRKFRLKCGHVCPHQCHPYENHKTIDCKKLCNRICKNDHACNKNAITRKLFYMPVSHSLRCGHATTIPCAEDPSQYKCRVLENRTLECGHKISTESFIYPLKILCDKKLQGKGRNVVTIMKDCVIRSNTNTQYRVRL